MTTIAHYEYEIDSENAIRVWDLNNPILDVSGNPPFMYQPTHPDNTPFEDAVDAKNYIENLINNVWLPAQAAATEATAE